MYQSTTPKHDDPNQTVVYASTTDHSVYGHEGSAYALGPMGPGSTAIEERRSRGTVCGCTMLVFVLATIIAILSAAVVGLAAGTGIEANRANDAVLKFQQLNASVVAQGQSSTPTPTYPPAPLSTQDQWSLIDRNCSASPETTTGQTYTTQCQCR